MSCSALDRSNMPSHNSKSTLLSLKIRCHSATATYRLALMTMSSPRALIPIAEASTTGSESIQ
jgi:hypothetical protein